MTWAVAGDPPHLDAVVVHVRAGVVEASVVTQLMRDEIAAVRRHPGRTRGWVAADGAQAIPRAVATTSTTGKHVQPACHTHTSAYDDDDSSSSSSKSNDMSVHT